MSGRIKQNLAELEERISEAARRSGRAADAVKLVAVTKYVDTATTRALVESGCNLLGENRPQQLWQKADELADLDIQWHMIGHLQRNKVRRTIGWTSLIHSVDSIRLMRAIANESLGQNLSTDCLLEVNVSGEEAKHGIKPDELTSMLETAAELQGIRICGLMCMAGLGSDRDQAAREFEALRELRDQFRDRTAPSIDLQELSMGMSGDFELAIEQGATIVRIGSAIFAGI